ncbi:hypothetical protein ES703_116475 [subsurface metagenome]
MVRLLNGCIGFFKGQRGENRGRNSHWLGKGVGFYNVSDLERRCHPRQLDDRILGRYTYYLAWLYNHLGRTESKVYASPTAKCINWLKD